MMLDFNRSSYGQRRNPKLDEGGTMETLLTEEDVAKQLHVSIASLRRWRLERRGPQFIKVGSLVRYRPEELEAWLASQPTGGANPTAPRRLHLSAAK
jgi:predicted DNA-binding transcriptional regulator AlpA